MANIVSIDGNPIVLGTSGIEDGSVTLAKLNSGVIESLPQPTDAQVDSAVSDWLDLHPEATTTVQDGSITNAKLVQTGGVLEQAGILSNIITTNMMGIDAQRNLYEGAADFSGAWESNAPTHVSRSNETLDGYAVMVADGSWRKYYKHINVEAGKKYTFEAWVKADNASNILMYYNEAGTATISGTGSKQFTDLPNGQWSKVSGAFTCTASGTVMPYVVSGVSTNLYISRFMLVEGESVFSLSNTIANVNAMDDAISEISDKTDCITVHENILDGLTVTESRVYYPNSSSTTTNEYANIYPPIQVEAGKTYYYKNLYGYFSTVIYVDSTTLQLSTGSNTTVSGSFTAPSNGTIYISVHKTASNFVLTTDVDLYNSISTNTYYSIDAEGIPRVYRVEKDGTGDFASLVDAINEATRYFDSIVYVGDGTWDLINELGSTYVESVSSTKRGIYLKNRIHLIFSSQAVVQCIYEGTRADTIAWLAAFNSGEYGFTLENANIVTGNIRYCVHDERGSNTDAYFNKYINCKMYHDSSFVQGGQNQCIGGGMGCDGYVDIEGCTFENPNVSGEPLVSFHNTASVGKSNVNVRNCYVAGSNTMRFRYYGQSTEKSIVVCSGNSLGSPIITGPETSGSTIENIELVAWNNEVRS